jgi:putative ABC transport system permease protein
MKNRLKTNSIRAISKALPRFFSLMIMSMLGVFTFSGLQATAPDMLKTLDNYLDKYNTYDIKLESYVGLSDEDIENTSKIDEVDQVEGIYSKDTIITFNEEESIVNISSLPKNINKLELLSGRLPTSADEIVVEKNLLSKNDLTLGDIITIEDDYFSNKEVKIVGTVNSSLYFNNTSINQNRGNTSIGSGTINYYAYCLADNFLQSNYSVAFVTVKGAKEEITGSKSYDDLISDAESKLENDSLIVTDRTSYSTYSDYIDDTSSITNLSKLFPTVFFAVAILISLISMNRMVEEDRLEIGTLKSLGFSNRQILRKYLTFSLLATIIGCLIGSALGLVIIPLMIFNIYKILFDIPNFVFTLNLSKTLLSFLIVIICVPGTSILTVYKVLKEKPADLMRPKSPKGGKRVILENIKFIWSHLSFSKKITVRNLFRYKKRVFVTVIGVARLHSLNVMWIWN